jgi:HEAT repeat protein
MVFGRRATDPAEQAAALIGVLRQQLEENRIKDIGTMNMPKYNRALQDLARLGPEAVPTLLEVLATPRADHDTPEGYVQDGVANAVAETLGAIGDPRAVEQLLAASRQHIVYATQALAEFPEGVEALFAGLDDPDEFVRSLSVQGLGSVSRDKPRVVEALTQALRDPSASVRRTAAQTAFRVEVANGALVDELGRVAREDSEVSVRDSAENAHWKLSRG